MSLFSQFKVTDGWVVNTLQAILALALGICLFPRLIHPATHGAIGTLTVGHSPQSMAFLYFVFGAAVAGYTFVLKESEAHKGHRALLYVIDLAGLVYLFFLCEWFRENIIFALYGLASG